LLDGFISGIWEYQNQRSEITLRVNLFSKLSSTLRDGIAAEAERLGQFLNKKVLLEFNTVD
jgi:hypothetical protein